MTGDTHHESLEDLVEDLRDLADEAEKDLQQRKSDTDLSGVDPSQMAVAERQGQMSAFQQAWRLAISHREDAMTDSKSEHPDNCQNCGSSDIQETLTPGKDRIQCWDCGWGWSA